MKTNGRTTKRGREKSISNLGESRSTFSGIPSVDATFCLPSAARSLPLPPCWFPRQPPLPSLSIADNKHTHSLSLSISLNVAAAAQESLAEKQQAALPRDTSADAAADAALTWPWPNRKNATLPALAPRRPPLPAFCALVYAPACGTDNVTYPNKCVAEARGASVAHAGACEGQERGLGRPYSFGRPAGLGAAAGAPAPAPAVARAASPSAAAAPAPRLLSPSSLAAARRAQPLNSELAAAAAAREAESADLAAVAPASSAAEVEAEVEAEAAEAELEAELEAEIEEAAGEKSAGPETEADDEEDDGAETSSREAAAEEAEDEAAGDIILAPPAPSRPATVACPRNYMPVCATVPATGLAKTFDNDCLARAEGATVARPGACSGAGTKSPGSVLAPTTAASSPAAGASIGAAAAATAAAASPAAAASDQPLATPASRGAGSSSSSSSGSSFSSFAAQRSPPSTRYRLPAIESPEEQERLDVGGGGGDEV